MVCILAGREESLVISPNSCFEKQRLVSLQFAFSLEHPVLGQLWASYQGYLFPGRLTDMCNALQELHTSIYKLDAL